jgi:hypothetical protein
LKRFAARHGYRTNLKEKPKALRWRKREELERNKGN